MVSYVITSIVPESRSSGAIFRITMKYRRYITMITLKKIQRGAR